jgi:acetoin utilization deacetylase AcuC-like enzyme
MTTQIIFSEKFNRHNIEGHPENAERTSIMLHEIKNSSLSNDLDFSEPEILPNDLFFELHSERMVEQIKERSKLKESWIDLDTYVCRNDYETSRLAAGGVLSACKQVLDGKIDNAFCLTRPPGHHATKERSMGFCLFNNAALAAHAISKQVKKVLIFDCDVHHGNGTQDIFYDRNDVMYQSFHLYPHFPGTGRIDEIGNRDGIGYTINAPLFFGNGDHAVSSLLEEIFLPIASQFDPEIIIVSTGFDSHYSDPLGGLRLTANFFGEIISYLQKIQPKIVCTLEGGYNLKWIGKCLLSQIAQLSYAPMRFIDTVKENESVKPVIEEIKNRVDRYWKI